MAERGVPAEIILEDYPRLTEADVADAMLRDIGLSTGKARFEISKPFWMN
jgi:hypothetical protein